MKKIFLSILATLCIGGAYAVPLAGTQTEQNLVIAFLGEASARDRYDFFAGTANAEGMQSIGKIFTETANMEKEHAQRFYSFLERDVPMVAIENSYINRQGTTTDNLRAAIAAEHNENSSLYLEMSDTALREGFDEIAADFKNIANAEQYHQKRFMTILANLENKTYFAKAAPVNWKCTNCGYHHQGTQAPNKCPACEHPQGYFIEIRKEYF